MLQNISLMTEIQRDKSMTDWIPDQNLFITSIRLKNQILMKLQKNTIFSMRMDKFQK